MKQAPQKADYSPQKADYSMGVSTGAVPAAQYIGGRRFAWTEFARAALLAFTVMSLAPCGSAFAEPPAAPVPRVIQTQETNVENVVAEFMECRRTEGVLTLKIRYRNTSTSAKANQLTFVHSNDNNDYPKYYVTAGAKKYFVLKDSDGTVLSSNAAGGSNGVYITLDPGKSYLWWGKYPAPPADVKKIDFITPLGQPFESVPIADH
jgi:hypothetical protein